MLTVVIPTYNEEESLPALLASLKSQQFTDFEVVVADAKSSDRTRAIATAAGARVVEGGKVAQGRNRGAAAAKGDVVLFLDADVTLPHPWFLQMAIGEFYERELVAATCKIEALSDRPVDKIFHGAFNAFMVATERVLPHAPGFCIFARRDVHVAIAGFDEEIRLAEDHDYVLRASKFGPFGVLRSCRIPVSVRRFDRDGRFNIAMKYLLCEVYMRTKGPVKTDIFKYTFGHAKKSKSVDKTTA